VLVFLLLKVVPCSPLQQQERQYCLYHRRCHYFYHSPLSRYSLSSSSSSSAITPPTSETTTMVVAVVVVSLLLVVIGVSIILSSTSLIETIVSLSSETKYNSGYSSSSSVLKLFLYSSVSLA